LPIRNPLLRQRLEHRTQAGFLVQHGAGCAQLHAQAAQAAVQVVDGRVGRGRRSLVHFQLQVFEFGVSSLLAGSIPVVNITRHSIIKAIWGD
jgi:hypothetical protein